MRISCTQLIASAVVSALLAVAAPATAAPSGVMESSLDESVRPLEDFYRFANGGWEKSHPLRSSRARSTALDDLGKRNYALLVDTLVANAHAPMGSPQRKASALYATCMDQDAIDRAGLTPLENPLRLIDAVQSVGDFSRVIASLQSIGVDLAFNAGAVDDPQDGHVAILGLGTRSTLSLFQAKRYTNSDAKSEELRENFVQTMARAFRLSGDEESEATENARSVLEFETGIVRNTPVADGADLSSQVLAIDELERQVRTFDWNAYFAAFGMHPSVVSIDGLNELKGLDAQLRLSSGRQLRAYLRWRLLRTYMLALPSDYDGLGLFYADLFGIKTMPSRETLCSSRTVMFTGSTGAGALSFHERALPPANKQVATTLIESALNAVRSAISQWGWASDHFRKQALAKIDKMEIQVAYPDQFDVGSQLDVAADRPFGENMMAALSALQRAQRSQIGKPLVSQWAAPPMMDATYTPELNKLEVTTAILQPPFFDPQDIPYAYGAIGARVAGQVLNAFTSRNLEKYPLPDTAVSMTGSERETLKKQAEALVSEYSAYEMSPSVRVDGALVAEEGWAALEGLRVAYGAFQQWQTQHPREVIDGFTPEQRFFLGFAQFNAESRGAERVQMMRADPAPYGKALVNVTANHFPEFRRVWSREPESESEDARSRKRQ